ncbi:hypothetical protein YC2023_010955 [Brassica napus]
MADYEKKISSIDKEIINIIKHLDKQKKLIKHQESVSTVSELKAAEPDLAAPIQEDQAKVSAPVIQKEKKPVQEVMVPIIQKVIEEEAPTEPQEDHGMNKLIVFDPSDFQRTFLSTFLISPFVWNKTRAVDLSRHEMGMKHVVFEPGGKLCSLRKKNQLIEKESAAATFDFVNFSTSEDKVLHASAQQEFHYETNWKRLPTLSWFQQTRKRSKWPPDHQDITRLAKHIGLNSFREMSMSDWVGRLQTYLWRPGAYVSIFIFLGEHSVRSRIILGNNELEADQNSLLLGHIKIWKPPDMQQLQHRYRV